VKNLSREVWNPLKEGFKSFLERIVGVLIFDGRGG
jgi:hypothetical protein